MIASSNFYARLAMRETFNASVRHINRTLDLLDASNPKMNLADNINSFLDSKELEAEEIPAVVNMLLVEKWKYTAVSRNLSALTMYPEQIATETAKWKAIDLIIGYHHPDLGFIVINPKNPESAAIISGFRKNELVVVYAGTQDESAGTKTTKAAAAALMNLLENKAAKPSPDFLSGPYMYVVPKKPAAKKAAPAKRRVSAKGGAAQEPMVPVYTSAPPATVSKDMGYTYQPEAPSAVTAAPKPAAPSHAKMSNLVSVVVTNELFHNGNVEAWKRIIRSYNAKYPNLEVFIYYDGERIVDINTLFKWGKVKHGSTIQFSVAGENIQDLAKLSRYFKQGASPQFEAFLHGSPDTVMNLF
ncbi:hypothetical protein K7I13_04755 [Brucepastera parasyntrophica]|uniref:hypothetical protein n=1 Tax=Brucepastera parasyntrophica TaxID=2880008 RepID=UPI002108A948|nr:hypothetical protein [Brucepastera parasyntrophica]ULQ60595.1 hypothetical protein K7I13_04755 [Brucepastera parasyntrophica]